MSEGPTRDAADGDRTFAGVAQVIGFSTAHAHWVGEVDGTTSRRCFANDYFCF
jgi:hypothetical protein